MELQIGVDLVLILRCLAGLLWGVLLACFLQFHRMGQFLAHERTWVSVIIGVGADLLLGIGATWWQLWLVVAFSSVGVIVRSLSNERQAPDPALNKYKTKWQMEEALDAIGDVITELASALALGTPEALMHVSKALGRAHSASRNLTLARYGEPEKKS